MLLDPFVKFVSDLVAGMTEIIELFFLGSACACRVVKRPVEKVILAEESGPDSRAGFICFVVSHDQVVDKCFAQVFFQSFGVC